MLVNITRNLAFSNKLSAATQISSLKSKISSQMNSHHLPHVEILPPLYLRRPIATTVCVVVDIILFLGISDNYEISTQISSY